MIVPRLHMDTHMSRRCMPPLLPQVLQLSAPVLLRSRHHRPQGGLQARQAPLIEVDLNNHPRTAAQTRFLCNLCHTAGCSWGTPPTETHAPKGGPATLPAPPSANSGGAKQRQLKQGAGSAAPRPMASTASLPAGAGRPPPVAVHDVRPSEREAATRPASGTARGAGRAPSPSANSSSNNRDLYFFDDEDRPPLSSARGALGREAGTSRRDDRLPQAAGGGGRSLNLPVVGRTGSGSIQAGINVKQPTDRQISEQEQRRQEQLLREDSLRRREKVEETKQAMKQQHQQQQQAGQQQQGQREIAGRGRAAVAVKRKPPSSGCSNPLAMTTVAEARYPVGRAAP